MANRTLLRVLVPEMARNQTGNVAKTIQEYLWQKQVAGLTIRRSLTGLADYTARQDNVLEDSAFNNDPLILEAVLPNEQLAQVLPTIKSMVVERGEVTTVPEEADNKLKNNLSEHMNVKIFMKNVKQSDGRDDLDVVLNTLQEAGIDWVSVTKGIKGFGKERKQYSPKFSFSKNVPVVIDIFMTEQQAQVLLPELEAAVTEGVVFKTSASLVIKNEGVRR
ncbi:DUF190 domain-containing protein [Lentilactobacillus senioris]|uniref:DUF190 domain-containing protein n=1 Tax=Lentilactobacillus senioris TaxID=931534 RepID=UPI0022816F4B|nr:DUF190 domain-containing protein [Lentilactobacillus senioris]MCY9806495.1 DUF190 domain-containing protein [Lentilactobacillus senioris]